MSRARSGKRLLPSGRGSSVGPSPAPSPWRSLRGGGATSASVGALARALLVSGWLGAGLAATPAMAEDPYYLSPGDRVGITVFDLPDISGNYLIEPSGEVNLPLLGSIDVSSLTPKGLQADLTTRLGNGYLQNPIVNVRLSELRPVTVVGAVRGAGRYTFVDGMTVETALALAGGSLRVTGEEAGQRLDLIRAEERVRTLKLTELSQRARKARLEAQLKDAASFEVSDPDPKNAETLKHFVADEQRTFDADRTAFASQTALLNQQIRTIQGDSQSFADQVELEKQQVDIIDLELADLGGLLSKGITRKSPVQDLQRERSKVQSNLSRVLGELARSKSALAEVKLRIDELGTTYHNRLSTELQAVTLLLEQTKISLPLARDEFRLREERLPFAMADEGQPQDVRISRYGKGRIETFRAGLDAPVRPGDILQVGQGSGAGAAAMPSRLPEPGAADPARPPGGADRTSSGETAPAPGLSSTPNASSPPAAARLTQR